MTLVTQGLIRCKYRALETSKRADFVYMFVTVRRMQIVYFNVHGSVHRKNIPIYIQQDATLHSLFHLETALHISGGTTTHHQERKQLYL